MDNVLITAGIAFVAAAIVGGGLKAFQIEIPALGSVSRQLLLGALGILLVAAGVLPNLDRTASPVASEGPYRLSEAPTQATNAAPPAPASGEGDGGAPSVPATDFDQPIEVRRSTLQPGTGLLFADGRVTSGMGVDRDIWWNRREIVPGTRMYSLGNLSDVRDVRQVASGEFDRRAFEPHAGEGFVVELTRAGSNSYAILRTIAVRDILEVEWLYPYTGEVTGR